VRALVARGSLSALLLAALLSCWLGPSFQLKDLPSDPLALVFRTREESEHRAELLARAKEERGLLPGSTTSGWRRSATSSAWAG
jgi:hypothetical protein